MRRLDVLCRCLVASSLILGGAAKAAELGGVPMPDAQDAAGRHLVLNGTALRTYSFLRIRIYVAGLYLPERSRDAAAIMASDEPKLFQFKFVRDVGAEAARRSWRESLSRSCQSPCTLPQASVDRFLGGIPDMKTGDTSTFLFTRDRLAISVNGQPVGVITDPAFMQTILATFIGAHPTAPDVKRAFLGAVEAG